MHPYLEHPERARAYALLIERPYGTLRTWATALGWTTGKMQRFIASLSRYRLGEIRATKHGTSFTPNDDPKVHRLVSGCTDVHRCASAPHLGTGSGLTGSRYAGTPATKEEPQPGADRLIEAMNEILISNLGEHYTAVALDNYGSHRAARRWLVGAGIPLEEAIVLLRRHVSRFDLSKEKNGKPPISLGYFTKPMLREWSMMQREREQLALLPAIDMQVERAHPAAAPIGSTMLHNEPSRPTSPETAAAARAEFEQGTVVRPARI